ncbi:MAG TPA: PCRF domain-containing protein, partial [Acidimicrobiales bacterium]
MLDRLSGLERDYEFVLAQLADPEVIADNRRLREASKRHHELEEVVLVYREHQRVAGDLGVACELLADAQGPERDELRAEIDTAEARMAVLEGELRLLLLPKDPNDGKNVIIEIRGAEGGEEANLFARDLHDMYVHYIERISLRLETLSADASEMGGYNQVTFLVKGNAAWSHLKYEGGPHRVQRVPV